MEKKEPTEAMEHAEPTDPMESTDPLEPIDRKESSDHNDHRDGIRPVCLLETSCGGVELGCPYPVGAMIGPVETVEVPQEVARLRRQFADRIAALDETAWGEASWCSGWQLRDVLAHLVRNAESTPWSLMSDLFRGGFRPDHSVHKAAMRLRGVPVPELADRLRRAADERLRSGSSSKPFGMGDVVVHSADAFRPIGEDVGISPDVAATVLDAYWHRARMVVHAAPHRGHRLVATDLDWSRGTGTEVRGRTIDLVLFVANRRQVLPSLEGPGLVPPR
jgi:uncharacterized protein (TIGR03083 family)